MTQDTINRLRLARSDGVGPVTYRRLLGRYGDAEAALAALPELARAGGRAAVPHTPSRADAERELAAAAKLGVQHIYLGTSGYPPLLAELPDAPPVLLVLGDIALLGARSVAIVGSRSASANGQRLAETIAGELAQAGIAVVSGMARGIDTAAHRGALATGRTIACVAGGLDVPYPEENKGLQAEIARNGAVVSEAPLGTAPLARHFPRRNRLIAGLTLGTVVVEAALRSGSLITARMALEANREVFAVPGSPLDPRGRGGNALIRASEARLVESAQDIIVDLPDGPRIRGLMEPQSVFEAPPDMPADATERIFALLGPEPTAVDDLIRRCQLPAATVAAVLLFLEIAGRIETLPGNRVAVPAYHIAQTNGSE